MTQCCYNSPSVTQTTNSNPWERTWEIGGKGGDSEQPEHAAPVGLQWRLQWPFPSLASMPPGRPGYSGPRLLPFRHSPSLQVTPSLGGPAAGHSRSSTSQHGHCPAARALAPPSAIVLEAAYARPRALVRTTGHWACSPGCLNGLVWFSVLLSSRYS